MPVPLLKLRDTLIVTIQEELSDAELSQLRTDIAQRVGKERLKGLVIDVSALEVLDSFASRMLVGIVKVSNLRGAHAVIVGIQPEVAFAMVQLGLTLEGVDTALDLDEGMTLLEAKRNPRGPVESPSDDSETGDRGQ
jgi:rsbT antagonist protein RsbS